MDYLCQHSDFEDIKMEDNSDHYLFNSLLNPIKTDQDHYIDGLFSPDALPLPSSQIIQSLTLPQERIIEEVSTYLSIKTTPIHDIMTYIDQYYPLSGQSHKRVYLAVRRVKLQLKREQAKKRNEIFSEGDKSEVQNMVNQLQQQDIKAQDSQLSPILFEDESQETRKKKRNRMSAQNSRDRKKEYIREIENQNKELRKKIVELTKTKVTPSCSNQYPKPTFSGHFRPQGKDLIKLIVCLGITCFLNMGQNQGLDNPCLKVSSILEQYTQQQKTSTQAIEETESKNQQKSLQLQFQNLKQALPKQQQNMLLQFLDQLKNSQLSNCSVRQNKLIDQDYLNQKYEMKSKMINKQFECVKKANKSKFKNIKHKSKRTTI